MKMKTLNMLMTGLVLAGCAAGSSPAPSEPEPPAVPPVSGASDKAPADLHVQSTTSSCKWTGYWTWADGSWNWTWVWVC